MAGVYLYVLIGVLSFVLVLVLLGYIYLFVKRYRRNMRGDIYLMPQDTRPKEELPVELRAKRDIRYKDAGVDPYTKEE